MSTNIRPELSKSNKYYISKHKYYELLHFCRQYKDWVNALRLLDEMDFTQSNWLLDIDGEQSAGSRTEKIIIAKTELERKISQVEKCAKHASNEYSYYILRSVTEGENYWCLYSKGLLCSRNQWYELYRKFFWLLSKER